MQKHIQQVDANTGEILEGATLAVFFPKRKNGFTEGWVAMAQSPMLQLAKSGLGHQALRVLFYALSKLDFENWINLNQSAAADELGMSRQNVNRAFGQLVGEGVILEGPKVGRNGTFRLNPAYGWRGSSQNHRQALESRLKASRMQVVK